ncbi:MAG: hypothetical protein ACRES7_04280 [Gammaproteobacteria bacterium]
MRRLLVPLCAAALVVLALPACTRQTAASNHDAPGTVSPPYVTLDANLTRLRHDFNANADKVRLVYIVGATCPGCLRGMDDVGKALAGERDNPNLRTYVIYVPALGARAKDIAPTVFLIPGQYVTRYWDPTGASGKLFDKTLGTGGFAWDVWMIYGAGERWDAAQPPQPDFWMDQLYGLPKWRYLNATTFAKKAKAYLERAG